jgi:cytochrome c biogenesis protein CcmG/thiol:disulfide interchange protein DsbE
VPVLRPSAAFAVALLAACILAGCTSEPRSVRAANPVKSAKDRKPAPEFALKDADGKTVRLEDYKGKVVLLDFFATWCGPCKIEIPWFMEMERKNKDKGFSVLGVSMDDEGWEVVKPFLADLGVNYRVVIGNDATAQVYGGVDALPTTFLIDRNGKIAAVHVGLASKKDFDDGIQQLLQDPGGIIKDIADASRGMALPAFSVRPNTK